MVDVSKAKGPELSRVAGEEFVAPDLSAIVTGAVSRLVAQGKLRGRVLIHRLVLRYLEGIASRGFTTGLTGLDEIAKLRGLQEAHDVRVELVGEQPRPGQELTPEEVNAAVREYAYGADALLVTADPIQAKVARAMGARVLLVGEAGEGSVLDQYFDEETMSVHLREGVPPMAKKGKPGSWRYERLGDRPLGREELEELANKVIEEAKRRPDGFVEIERPGSTIVQIGPYRVVIARPPMSDGWEITAVRPVRRLRLEEYELPPKVLRRLEERAEGILIAGAPGMGKTTFAQALAEYYMGMGKVVKTIESPRDMLLPEAITQYSKNYATPDELHDILLLSRPDYTVFDEMRNDEDFKLFADLRLAGIGMIGVVHATSPIDAIQRFIGRVELGMIPSLVDTVIFIDRGRVEKVYEVRMVVKLPTGLREAELSRPVVEVRDFLTGELEYEIYTFGEQTVVVPVKKLARPRSPRERFLEELAKLFPEASVEFDGDVAVISIPRDSALASSKNLKKLKRLENRFGVRVRVRLV
ncbi:MAG: PINc/VapC family ATPase [Desulfurococcaceae archaeon]